MEKDLRQFLLLLESITKHLKQYKKDSYIETQTQIKMLANKKTRNLKAKVVKVNCFYIKDSPNQKPNCSKTVELTSKTWIPVKA